MTRGMHTRLAVAIAAVVALLAGTFWGDDDNFPFGPFRMYSTKQELDGEVRVIEIAGLDGAGTWVPLPFSDFGLRRADVEGQLGVLAQPPVEVLADMAVAYDRLGRGEVDLVALRLFERTIDIEDGMPAGETVEIIATWSG